MRRIIIFLLVILTASCTTNKFTVQYKGALKKMMHKGDISAKTDLKLYESINHLYALGALENLKGEIQIFDSKSYNTILIDSTLSFDNSFNKKASLFVYVSVKKWKAIDIPESVITYEQLESFIAQTAKENQLNVNEPFPFLLEGTPKSIDWHVINWKEGDTVHSHQKHINSGPHGTLKNRKVDMLGFYSDSHHAIFTHHTTNMHIHVKTDDNNLAGHVDNLTLGKEMVLKLPKVR